MALARLPPIGRYNSYVLHSITINIDILNAGNYAAIVWVSYSYLCPSACLKRWVWGRHLLETSEVDIACAKSIHLTMLQSMWLAHCIFISELNTHYFSVYLYSMKTRCILYSANFYFACANFWKRPVLLRCRVILNYKHLLFCIVKKLKKYLLGGWWNMKD